MARGYARSREKDEAARAALEPLRPGERPTAVTVGAIAAAALALAQLVAMIVGFDADEPRKAVAGALGIAVMALVALGMWRARYWGVLGMQTVLALAIVFASLALIGAKTVVAAVVLVLVIVAAGTLFWFLVKAMARIQMPARPGAERT